MQKAIQYRVLILVLAISFLLWKDDPQIIPWVWEYPTDLRFMQSGSTIAYYAGSITLSSDSQALFIPRRQPLFPPKNPKTIPVIRIENVQPGSYLSDENMMQISRTILSACMRDTNAIGCQIDFDAVESEHAFYASVINSVREGLSNHQKLSLTALVSWCYPNGWLDSLGVKAIPMFFRMGPEAQGIRDGHVPANFLQASVCRDTLGVALDEPLPSSSLRRGRDTIYVFAPQGWTKADYHQIEYFLSR